MPIRGAAPAIFLPTGLSDAVDESSAFPGACQSIINFCFDRSSRGALVPIPGRVPISFSTSGFTTPGVVSAMFMVGPVIYGMIATADFPGKDRPFVYNTSTGSFVAVTNVSAPLLPATQSIAGDWQPPSMDMIGQYVVVTHPGFPGTGGIMFGWFDLTTPGTIKWNAGNTATNGLPSVPQWVSQFFGRAYFAVGNKTIPTDILNPLNVTNVEFADTLTFGDTTNIVGMRGLPIGQAQGGVLQALLVFKNKSIWQITGDPAINTLASNQVIDSVGTYAPLSLVTMPQGVGFMSPTAMRIVNLLGQVPFMSQDVVGPWTQASTPSRAAGCFVNSVYRMSVITNFKQQNNIQQDYWFDTLTNKFNGPHTTPFNHMVTDGTRTWGANDSLPGFIFEQEVAPVPDSVYTDNGNSYTSSFQSCNLEEPNESVDKQIVESTIELSGTSLNTTYTISATDEKGNILNSVSINVENSAAVWGAFNWGAANWQAAAISSYRYGIPWTNPLVYDKLQLNVSVPAAQFVSVKKIMNRVQTTNHMSQQF